MASTFDMKASASSEPIEVNVDESVLEIVSKEKIKEFTAFRNWFERLQTNFEKQKSSEHTFAKDPWRLKRVRVRDVTMFGSNIGFMTIEAFLEQKTGKPLDRVIFLRGGSVAVLMILRPKDRRSERYVILTEQPRVGACSTSFLEIPAGMLDDQGDVKLKAIQETLEETGLEVLKEELIDMTKLALKGAKINEDLQPAMYPSPANLDEYIPLLLWEKELDRKEIESLRGRPTGNRSQDELITLHVREYDVLWKEGARDAKTLAAWALYEGLYRSGEIERELKMIRKGTSTR